MEQNKIFDLAHHLTGEEFNRLINCKTEQEWADACDSVKLVRNGEYPTEWFMRMNMSGLMSKIFSRFNNG